MKEVLKTLDKRIEEDLKQLYNNGEITGAVDLDGLVEKENEGIYWVGDVNTSSFSPEEKKVVELLKSNSGISKEQLAVQAQMSEIELDDILHKKLREKGCADNIKDEISFATRALPVYTGGKRGAKTVMVMLNPGKGVKDSNKDLLIELKKRSMFTMLSKLCCGGACPQVTSSNVDLTKDINNYNDFNAHYGNWDKNRHDNFDLKQAFFLRDWPEDSEVGVDKKKLNDIIEYNKDKNDKTKVQYLTPEEKRKVLEEKRKVQDLKLEEKRKVLMNKQQLELIPYASRQFDKFNPKMIEEVFPYVETLLEEIFSVDRKYVIFCSAIFEEVFKAYNVHNKQQNRNINVKSIHYNTQLPGLSKKVSCCVLDINYYGQNKKAVIANTFPRRDITYAYDAMAAYGEFCYNCLLKHLP